MAPLGQGRNAVRIKGPVVADLAKHLAGAADCLGLDILEHEQEQIVVLILTFALEPGLRFGQFGFERRFVGGQVGEPAPGQLGKVV